MSAPVYGSTYWYHDLVELRLRLPDDIHRRLRAVADEDGSSLNTEIVIAIEDYLAKKQTSTVRALARRVAQRDAELLERLSR